MNKIIIGIIALLIIGGGAFFYLSQQNVVVDNDDLNLEENRTNGDDVREVINEVPIDGEVMGNIIIYTDNGYIPSRVEINVGDIITFVNESSRDTWPATALHPTHTVYPGSNISKCGTEEEGDIFDSCGGIVPGDSWSFIFNEVGEWGYHDHLKANHFGKIVVE